MIELVTDIGFDCGYDEILAKETGDTLYKTYHNFTWIISIRDHNVIIRLGEAIQEGWCYLINRKDIPIGSPEKFRRMVIRAGGEMLERLNLQRKAKEDGLEVNQIFEGSEAKVNLTAAGLKQLRPKDIIIPG